MSIAHLLCRGESVVGMSAWSTRWIDEQAVIDETR
jgi:hypothetical protein